MNSLLRRISLNKEGWSMESNADKHGMNSAAKREPHEHQDHHAHMAADFRKRLWISLVLTLPILVLSPLLQCIDHCR
jgi:Cu2+-exporting ATPase